MASSTSTMSSLEAAVKKLSVVRPSSERLNQKQKQQDEWGDSLKKQERRGFYGHDNGNDFSNNLHSSPRTSSSSITPQRENSNGIHNQKRNFWTPSQQKKKTQNRNYHLKRGQNFNDDHRKKKDIRSDDDALIVGSEYITTDFDTLIQESNGAKRYKVHKSNCSCSKMKMIRDRYGYGEKKAQGGMATVTGTDMDTGDGDRGLMVVPDIKHPKLAFSFRGKTTSTSTLNSVDADSTMNIEEKLRDIIFGKNGIGNDIDRGIKVSCAMCLLEDMPNGFVCLCSTNKSAMKSVRDKAMKRMNDLMRNKGTASSSILSSDLSICTNTSSNNDGRKALHHDHADFVESLTLSFLHRVRTMNRKRSSKAYKTANERIKLDLEREGVQLDGASMDNLEHVHLKIELGHHLLSVMSLLNRRKKRGRETHHHHERDNIQSHNDSSYEERKEKETYIFVIVRKKERKRTGTGRDKNSNDGTHNEILLEIDLPGGKRHLGESSWECAIRETEEESSLRIDEDWLVGDGTPMMDLDQGQNAYFLLEPPIDSCGDGVNKTSSSHPTAKGNEKATLSDIEKSFFWTNTGLSS